MRCVFHKVRLKPGKPLWFGVGPPRADRPPALVFGLPGNPVSGLVGFLLFVKRTISVLAGKPEPSRRLPSRTACQPIFSSRRSNDVFPVPDHRLRELMPPFSHRSNPSPGRDRPICGQQPKPTASPSSPPAIAITCPVKSSTSSLFIGVLHDFARRAWNRRRTRPRWRS